MLDGKLVITMTKNWHLAWGWIISHVLYLYQNWLIILY